MMTDAEVKPNAHGMYPDANAEHLILPRLARGWMGCPTAEIRLLETRNGWLSAAHYDLSGHGGGGYGLSPKWHGGFLPDRKSALAHAVAYIADHSRGTHRDAVRITLWLASLTPAQLSLF